MLGGDESTQVTAGIAGFLVLLGLAVACFFLFRSMNSHLRNVTFTERQQTGQPGAAPAPGEATSHELPDDDPIGGRPSV